MILIVYIYLFGIGTSGILMCSELVFPSSQKLIHLNLSLNLSLLIASCLLPTAYSFFLLPLTSFRLQHRRTAIRSELLFRFFRKLNITLPLT